MIILNGKKFAENENEFTDSLFETDGTCVGYAKKNKVSVTLSDYNHKKVGIINNHSVLCNCLMVNGKPWYTHADIDIIGRYESNRQEREELHAIIDSL